MLCGRRRIKPTQTSTLMGVTHVEHMSEGMCRQCAWERIKLKCKLCGEIIGKGFPRLLAHTTAHYTSNELLYNEEIEKNIILMNFENPKASNKLCGEIGYDYALPCKVCGNRFPFKKEEMMFSKWINHIISHYSDKDLVKKEWIAKDIIHINYDSVLEISNSHKQDSVTYRELTESEGEAYRNALHRIRSEESITKTKGK
jgi:hypothetical protein